MLGCTVDASTSGSASAPGTRMPRGSRAPARSGSKAPTAPAGTARHGRIATPGSQPARPAAPASCSSQFARHRGSLELGLLLPDAPRRPEEQECESYTDPRKDGDREEGRLEPFG